MGCRLCGRYLVCFLKEIEREGWGLVSIHFFSIDDMNESQSSLQGKRGERE